MSGQLYRINRKNLPDYEADKGRHEHYLDELMLKNVLTPIVQCEHGKIDEHSFCPHTDSGDDCNERDHAPLSCGGADLRT